MIKLYETGVYLAGGSEIIQDNADAAAKLKQLGVFTTKEEARRGTIAHGILTAHNRSGDERNLRLTFDSLTSHDITYVGIIQTGPAAWKSFPCLMC